MRQNLRQKWELTGSAAVIILPLDTEDTAIVFSKVIPKITDSIEADITATGSSANFLLSKIQTM